MSQPIIFLVGPTGSGKTDRALQIARRHHGEIICADSRTVYRGLDIGTAKPTAEEQAEVRHWGLDLVNPDEAFSAHEFKVRAQNAIKDIHRRGKLPIVVGGTGLYIDTLLYDMQLGPKADPEKRQALSRLSVEELQRNIMEHDLQMPQNMLNKRHLIRAIELDGKVVKKNEHKILDSIVVGISTDKEKLLHRLRGRARAMFHNPALFEETRLAVERYGWDAPGLSGNIYRLVRQIEAGQMSHEEAIEKFVTLDWQLAKRQMTWFHRNPDIVWLEFDQVAAFIDRSLMIIPQHPSDE